MSTVCTQMSNFHSSEEKMMEFVEPKLCKPVVFMLSVVESWRNFRKRGLVILKPRKRKVLIGSGTHIQSFKEGICVQCAVSTHANKDRVTEACRTKISLYCSPPRQGSSSSPFSVALAVCYDSALEYHSYTLFYQLSALTAFIEVNCGLAGE